MSKIPITYTGSDTTGLYVTGLKNGKEIKIKVKDLSCCGGIILDGTDGATENAIRIGETFNSLKSLSEATLSENTIYFVNDKGTIEQYVFQDGNLIQIAGNLNEIISGNEENEDEKSSTLEDEDGIIDYNLPELVNGDYRFKNHSNITTVYCDMPSLISGVQMFYGTSLKSFCGNLSSLDNGRHMFSRGCKLDEESIISIVDGIKDWSFDTAEHIIEIGYDSSKVSASFISDVEREFISKGWIVNWKPDGNLKINLSK